ncbi:MAG: rRNA pseudouridine synthase [Alphaproteobacteria bacterium]|nr:rRNA pseudouridine synthase [Alphaproteobacteria bacterium]
MPRAKRVPGDRSGPTGGGGERIAKVIARAGLCSRRQAEAWIADGRVAVDGVLLTSPAVRVTPSQTIVVDGKALPVADRTRIWLFHKPRGCLTTTKDPRGRPTIFSRFPPSFPRVVTVGRLDFNSEGLLVLTNDGELARRMSHPRTAWPRRYRVRAHGRIDQTGLDGLKDGITVDGIHYGPIIASLDRSENANAWITLTLTEGKNREVRKVLEHLGLAVNRLIRVTFGPFELGDLARGMILEMPPKQAARLARTLPAIDADHRG